MTCFHSFVLFLLDMYDFIRGEVFPHKVEQFLCRVVLCSSFDHLLTIENTTTVNLDNTNRSLIVSSYFMTRFVASRAVFVLGTYISKPLNNILFYKN